MIRIVLLLLFPVLLHAQTAPSLNVDECGGGKITRSESYRGRALAGYMNGGAELYHEYGFVALSVQDVVLKDAGTVTVEVFRMSSAMAAFGILSIFRQGCTQPDSVDICAGPYQVQGIAGDCYIRVQSGTNTPEALASRLLLCRHLMRRIGGAVVMLSPAFRDPRTAIVMYGPIGVQNGMPDLGEMLEGAEGYAVQAEWVRTTGEAIDLVAEVSFASDERAGGFLAARGVQTDGGDVVEVPGYRGWWVFVRPGKPVQILRGAVDKDHAIAFFRRRTEGRN